MKAIRLVANKLYPLPAIAQQIEDFAKDMLFSTVKGGITERTDAVALVTRSQMDIDSEKPTNEHQAGGMVGKDSSSDTDQSCMSESASSSISEAQRCMSLYFALCTKKHYLFREVFIIYKSASKSVKQAIHRHIPILVRTMGSSSELLEIISDPPSGSENLLMQVLHTLTDGTVPSPELVSNVRRLFDAKFKDVEILFPILPFLPRDEVLLIFPQLVNLPLDKFQLALPRLLQPYLFRGKYSNSPQFQVLGQCFLASSHSGQGLSPAEVLIAIHAIDPDRDAIPLKKVTDACNACFEQRQIFTQQVLAKVLNQLVEQIPLPLLFMRTVLQAIGAFPSLVEFIMEILSRLVSKQIWKYPKLWVGFLKCAQLTKPQSFGVLLQLPPPQLENALNRVASSRLLWLLMLASRTYGLHFQGLFW
ncbi:symplekin-like isoform X3 [Carica papaya]|nr:symplekin-like isoform X3 [Carica papaya]